MDQLLTLKFDIKCRVIEIHKNLVQSIDFHSLKKPINYTHNGNTEQGGWMHELLHGITHIEQG